MRSAGDGDLTPLVRLLGERILDVLRMRVLTRQPQDELLVLEALTDEDLGLAALRKAAHRRRLEVVERDGRCFSTREAVAEYKRSRHRRRSDRPLGVTDRAREQAP